MYSPDVIAVHLSVLRRLKAGTHGSMATAAAPDGIPLFLAARL